ncbi:chitinase [Streptomyces sp. NBC_01317]|uniref:chitinase n=1 Tax=Streptomyces sp. NBC_01317 TaxID=2903822 RepID=UPI002E137F5E|nr:chitinase [Streptomyces sp. NBC_01317]
MTSPYPSMLRRRPRLLAATAALSLAATAALAAATTATATADAGSGAPAAKAAAAVPVGLNAPYLYLGWGSPQSATSVMSATGVKQFTMAFILSDGGCNPKWDGSRALTGGNDQSTINAIRAAGGDVTVSIGGWSGNKLGEKCASATALAGAYQKTIDALKLKSIDIDIEDTEFTNATVRERVVDALKIIKTNNPGVTVYVTFGTTRTGPDATGLDLIKRGANNKLDIEGWAVMPFDFDEGTIDMVAATKGAVDGLKNAVASAYGLSSDAAYRKVGFSSMNGKSDVPGETVSVANFKSMVSYATSKHLSRVSFWAVNRDRACGGSTTDAGSDCSGVSQSALDFTKALAAYTG